MVHQALSLGKTNRNYFWKLRRRKTNISEKGL